MSPPSGFFCVRVSVADGIRFRRARYRQKRDYLTPPASLRSMDRLSASHMKSIAWLIRYSNTRRNFKDPGRPHRLGADRCGVMATHTPILLPGYQGEGVVFRPFTWCTSKRGASVSPLMTLRNRLALPEGVGPAFQPNTLGTA